MLREERVSVFQVVCKKFERRSSDDCTVQKGISCFLTIKDFGELFSFMTTEELDKCGKTWSCNSNTSDALYQLEISSSYLKERE